MNVVLDTTVLAKGAFPPRRRKEDDPLRDAASRAPGPPPEPLSGATD